MRGEQGIIPISAIRYLGSPPLARGTGARRNRYLRSGRITPACAGNSVFLQYSHPLTPDHPRLRGEQIMACLLTTRKQGSPPLARGTERKSMNSIFYTGITPACAGNRRRMQKILYCCWDHPRLRGEQTKKRLVVSCILQYRFSFFNQFFVDMFC